MLIAEYSPFMERGAFCYVYAIAMYPPSRVTGGPGTYPRWQRAHSGMQTARKPLTLKVWGGTAVPEPLCCLPKTLNKLIEGSEWPTFRLYKQFLHCHLFYLDNCTGIPQQPMSLRCDLILTTLFWQLQSCLSDSSACGSRWWEEHRAPQLSPEGRRSRSALRLC